MPTFCNLENQILETLCSLPNLNLRRKELIPIGVEGYFLRKSSGIDTTTHCFK